MLLCVEDFIARHFVPPPSALHMTMLRGDSAVRKRLQQIAQPRTEKQGEARAIAFSMTGACPKRFF